MDRLDYALEIESLLDEACAKLSDRDFQKLIELVVDMVENYEQRRLKMRLFVFNIWGGEIKEGEVNQILGM